MKKVQIFVVAHKAAPIPKDEVLVPIHVGRALSTPLAGMIGDDTGENISEKNPQYCEMTAHYWIWKNVKDTEFVGVCHYRRYFGIGISEENIEQLMKGYDVMMVEPSFYTDSVYSYFAKFMGAENMTILSLVMKQRCPDFFETLEKVCDGIKFHPFNMLLCWKPLFDDYCEWMFGILGECEKYIKPAPYTNARRALAYMAEMLTGVYFLHRQLRIKTVPYDKVEGDQRNLIALTDEERQKWSQLESLLQHELADQVIANRKEKFDNPAILLGLQNDGVKE